MICIVTDSTADLAPEVKRQYPVSVIPLNVHLGGESYKDGIDITSEVFFTKLRTVRELPTTSMPSPNDFTVLYGGLLLKCTTIISLHLSSKLSGTYNAATCAKAEFQNADIVVVDSGLVSVGLHLLVFLCLRELQKGVGREALLEKINQWKREIGVYFLVDTLEYLQRGGRIGRAAHLIGSILNIKPILTLRDGLIDTAGKVRSRQKAYYRLIELINRDDTQPRTIVLGHAAAKDDCVNFAMMLKETFVNTEIVRTEIGPVIGTHSGPGCIGVAFW